MNIVVLLLVNSMKYIVALGTSQSSTCIYRIYCKQLGLEHLLLSTEMSLSF